MLDFKIILIIIQLLCTIIFSGIVFGWAPFELMMIKEGLYSCSSNNNNNNNNNNNQEECISQNTNFKMLFTISTSVFMISSLFVGLFVDHYGPTYTTILNGIVITSSLILIGISPVEYEGLFILIAFLLGLGGTLTLTGSFPIGFVVDQKYMPILISAINCFFDASAIIFLFCYLLYTHLNLSRFTIFVGFGIISAILYTTLAILWYLVEPEFNEKKKLTSEYNPTLSTSIDTQLTPSSTTNHPVSVKVIHSRNWKSNIKTNVFMFISTYAAIQVLRVNSYFGTILQILESLGDENHHYLFTQIFTALLPLGFLCLPLIEYSFKNYGFLGSFHILNGLSIAYNVTVLIPNLQIQVITFILFITCRALLYSLIGTYIAHMFGPLNSGKMYGLLSWIGVGMNTLQYPLYIMATKFYPGYIGLEYLNIFYLFLCLPLLWLVISSLQKILRLYFDGDIKEHKVEVYEEMFDDHDEENTINSLSNKINQNKEIYNQIYLQEQSCLEIEDNKNRRENDSY